MDKLSEAQKKAIYQRELAKMVSVTHFVDHLQVRLHHGVDAELIFAMTDDGRSFLKTLQPVTVHADDKRFKIPLSSSTSILVGKLVQDEDNLVFRLITDRELSELLHNEKPENKFWKKMKLVDLEVLVRSPWTASDVFSTLYRTEADVQNYVARCKEKGALYAEVRTNRESLAQSNWGIDYAVYPILKLTNVSFLNSYLEARWATTTKYDCFHRGGYIPTIGKQSAVWA